MFRLSQFMRAAIGPVARPPARPPAGGGPVVIWNLLRRCNLACLHCYAQSSDRHFTGELTTPEIFRVLEDLRAAGVGFLILSGGEPTLHPDLARIAGHAKDLGFHVGLSSNGTLIDAATVTALAATGYDYLGVSLDGLAATHDHFRRQEGAFAAALNGVRLARDAGLAVGLRLTLTETTAADLPDLLELTRAEGIGRFFLSHLNFAGRGATHQRLRAMKATTRRALDLLLETARADAEQGRALEIVTGNNDADGAYFLMWARRHAPERAEAVEQRLSRWGGNASGVGIANIDSQGTLRPDTMWTHHSMGNLREAPFAQLWNERACPVMAALRERPRPVGGRCRDCRFLMICNGNTRVRAFEATGDVWAEDPGCYLSDGEIKAEGRA